MAASPAVRTLLAIGSVPNSDGLCLDDVGVQTDHGYVPVNNHMQSNIPHICLPATSQDAFRIVGRHDADARSPNMPWGSRRVAMIVRSITTRRVSVCRARDRRCRLGRNRCVR